VRCSPFDQEAILSRTSSLRRLVALGWTRHPNNILWMSADVGIEEEGRESQEESVRDADIC
jgi:hypothetical protein